MAANGFSSQGTSGRCWNKVMDFAEAKVQVLFAVPMVLCNVFYFSITMVSVMFAGHLGEVELAGSTLASSWANVTGFVFMVGLSGALETLCGQGFGAKMYNMLGIYLQTSCIISFLFSIIISVLWFFTEPILVLLHQDPQISRTAALYMKYLIPGLFAFGFLQNILSLKGWALEILVFLAGLMSNPEITTSLIAICVNTQNVAYMITYGLSAAASTRVSNELGAGNPNKAKHAMAVTLKLSILLAVAMALTLLLGHDIWIGFFSDSHSIIKKFTDMTFWVVISIAIDTIQGIFSGVVRGCGWQKLAVLANFGTYYFIGMPIAIFLGFKVKLYVKGLWIGLICGLFCQACTLMLIIICKKMIKINLSEKINNNESQLSV
ncbi:hypothetical protein GQ457_08G006680 [Hibiscus cannabinus]